MKFRDALRKGHSLVVLMSALAGVASLCLTVYLLPASNEKLVGKWTTQYSYPITGGVIEFLGTTDYLSRGRYNVSGRIFLRLVGTKTPSEVQYAVDGAGVWSGSATSLSITLNDLKSAPVYIISAGKKLEAGDYLRIFNRDLPDFSIPSGTSTDYNILSQGRNVVVLEAPAPSGKKFSLTMRRIGS